MSARQEIEQADHTNGPKMLQAVKPKHINDSNLLPVLPVSHFLDLTLTLIALTLKTLLRLPL